MLNVFKPFSSILYSSPAPVPHYTVESLTRDVNVKPLHSHNDYWRHRSFFDALSHGCQSIESDVWKFTEDYEVQTAVTGTKTNKFFRNEVYVGHNQIFLKNNETLDSLYLDPIYNLLAETNPIITPISQDLGLQELETPHGIFYNSPETTLYLWMDFKTEATELYRTINKLLVRFIEKDYLSYYDVANQKYVEKPVTITISGNLPIDAIREDLTKVSRLYTFIDAPLHEFINLSESELKQYAKMSRVASSSMAQLLGHTNFKTNDFSSKDLETLKKVFDKAHDYGFKTRIWGDINWPESLVYNHNLNLVKLGCDFINTDDLEFGSRVLN